MGRKDSVHKQKSHVLLPGWMKQQDLFQYPAIQTGWKAICKPGHSSPRLLLRVGEGEKEVYQRRNDCNKAVGEHVCRQPGNEGG